MVKVAEVVVSQTFEVQEALKQVQAATKRQEKQCWLPYKLSEDQAAYIRGLGYTLTFGVDTGTLTW